MPRTETAMTSADDAKRDAKFRAACEAPQSDVRQGSQGAPALMLTTPSVSCLRESLYYPDTQSKNYYQNKNSDLFSICCFNTRSCKRSGARDYREARP